MVYLKISTAPAPPSVMQRLIPSLVTASLLVAVPITPSVALAAPLAEESFDTLTARAAEKYSEGDYEGAIDLFERAYALDPVPNLLFNIGRIYEEAGKYEDAIVYYERFIAEPQVDLETKQFALDRRDLAKAVVEIQRKDGKTPAEVPGDPAPTEPTQPPSETTPEVPPTTPEEGTPKPRNLRPLGYTLFGLGGGALIVGGIVGGIAKGEERNFHSATTRDEAEAAKARGLRLGPAADGLFIAGGILAAAGIVMLLLPQNRKGAADKRARLVPQTSPTQVGLGVVGRF